MAAFLWLFLQTEYRGIDQLPYPVSLLFRIDPLAALADFLAPGPFGWSILWPALVVLLLTSLFGRFFCGWVCPLGATLDGLGKLQVPHFPLATSYAEVADALDALLDEDHAYSTVVVDSVDWLEPLGGPRVKHSYSPPRWQGRRGQVGAHENVTLYGLPIVSGRTVGEIRRGALDALDLVPNPVTRCARDLAQDLDALLGSPATVAFQVKATFRLGD